MKKRRPDDEEIVRVLTEIRSDLAELRELFERVRARMEAQQPRAEEPGG